MTIPTLLHCVEHGAPGLDADRRDHVLAALQAREDTIRDGLFLAGSRFGLFPQIVAEVLAEVGLGTPYTEAERAMIRQNFTGLMDQIAAAQRGEGPMPQPPMPT